MTEPQDDFSPALGGAKAQPEPAPPPPAEEPAAAAEAPSSTAGGTSDEIPPELAALLAPFGRLAEIFADAAEGRAPTPGPGATPGTLGLGDQAAEVLAREVEAFMGGAIRELSQRLPATLAALGGIVDAVEQAVAPLAEELGGAIDAAAARNASSPAPEIVDAVDPAEPIEIPPVDLPPSP